MAGPRELEPNWDLQMQVINPANGNSQILRADPDRTVLIFHVPTTSAFFLATQQLAGVTPGFFIDSTNRTLKFVWSLDAAFVTSGWYCNAGGPGQVLVIGTCSYKIRG